MTCLQFMSYFIVVLWILVQDNLFMIYLNVNTWHSFYMFLN